MIRPLGNNVTAKIIEASNVTKSGLYMMDGTAQALAPKVAEILGVGTSAKDVKVGDKVVFKPYATYEVEDKGVKLVMLEDVDILGVIED